MATALAQFFTFIKYGSYIHKDISDIFHPSNVDFEAPKYGRIYKYSE